MKGRLSNASGRVLDYENFILDLKDESKAADRRSVLHLMARLRSMEVSMDERFKEMTDRLDELLPSGRLKRDSK